MMRIFVAAALLLAVAAPVRAQKRESIELRLGVTADKAEEMVRVAIASQNRQIEYKEGTVIGLTPYPMPAKRTYILTVRFNVVPLGADSSVVTIEGTARNTATAGMVPSSMAESDVVIDEKRGGFMKDAWKTLERWAQLVLNPE
ncbi:MAG: hypothetical protein H0U64_10125 [Gemmatimonadaceae bacterium]|nr:hypothetical protein [Gemmatimonadaceae bacterium]